jgi:hypothetical protein
MLISADNHVFPLWAPDWLRHQVESPDCSNGTHPCLRQLAKWLTIYFGEHEGAAARWLKHAAALCDREVPAGEIDRLLVWAEGLFGKHGTAPVESQGRSCDTSAANRPQIDLDNIYCTAVHSCRGGRKELRERSPSRLYDSAQRQTDLVLDAWSRYAEITDPLVCFGADDLFWTRPHSAVRGVLHVHAQVVPNCMSAPVGMTQSGHLSEHSKENTGERIFLINEFDFAKTTPKGKPTIWAPLLDCIEARGMTVLDLNAALIDHLAIYRPLWMVVFSGSKSLQAWFPCRGESEEEVQHWFRQRAEPLGACHSTLCKSQFVRMPDGTRAPNSQGQSVRQQIEYYNPAAL